MNGPHRFPTPQPWQDPWHPDVVCNGGRNPTIKKGETFTCEATIDSVRWQFPVKFTDNAGNYEVGPPQ